MTHTPGPWREVSWNSEPTIIHYHKDDGEFDIIVLGKFNAANAKLIVAAPDLLKAAKWLLPMAEHYLANAPSHPDNAKLESARAAIAKAEGK